MNHDATAGAEFDLLVPVSDAQHAFEHVPGFIITAVHVPRRNHARRVEDASLILPLGDHKVGL